MDGREGLEDDATGTTLVHFLFGLVAALLGARCGAITEAGRLIFVVGLGVGVNRSPNASLTAASKIFSVIPYITRVSILKQRQSSIWVYDEKQK